LAPSKGGHVESRIDYFIFQRFNYNQVRKLESERVRRMDTSYVGYT